MGSISNRLINHNSAISLVLGLALALSVSTLLLSPTTSEWLGLGLIVLAGIPHGSYDLRVAESLLGSSFAKRGLLVFVYLLVGLAMSGLCLLWPTAGLALFLAISALHFVEGERIYSPPLTALLSGVGAILLPISYHFESASKYLAHFVADNFLLALSAYLRPIGITFGLLLAASLILDYCRQKRSEIAQHAVCLLAWILLPPLSGFCVWFIGRHSSQHLQRSRTIFAKATDDRKIPLDFIALSITAIALITPLALIFDLSDLHQLFAASIVLIAGLTLPHMITTHLGRS
jgi:Brp/Blh family beta-carotene 15,15'-monooxygenase